MDIFFVTINNMGYIVAYVAEGETYRKVEVAPFVSDVFTWEGVK